MTFRFRFRWVAVNLLWLSTFALIGCGQSSSTATQVEAGTEPVNAAQLAQAQAERDQVNNEEEAYQRQNQVGKQQGRGR